MRNLTLFFCGLLISISLTGQDYKEIDFSIILGDCFKNDTISLAINEKQVFDSEVITSDFSTGLTGFSAYQDKNNFSISKIKQNRIKQI